MPAPAPYLGRTAAMGIGAESTWGTAVSRTVWFPIISESMKRTVKKVARPTLSDGIVAARRTHFTETDEAGGDVEVLATYEGFGLLLAHAFGTSATGSPTGSIYPHTYSLAATLPTGLTVEIVRGTGTAEVFEGCKIAKLVAKIDTSGLLRVTISFIGQTSGGRASAGTPSYTTSRDLVVLHHQIGTVGWNSGTYYPTGLEFSLDNSLSRRHLLGDTATSEPVRTDYAKIMVKMDLEWSADALNTALTADTEADLSFVFTGTNSRTWTFNLQNAYIDEVSDPVNTVGVIKQSATFIGQDDGTNYGATFVIENTQTTAVEA